LSSGLRIEREGVVATIVLERSPGNRFSWALMQGFRDTLQALALESELRVLGLRATGPDFSFGADLMDPDLATRMRTTEGQQEVAQLGEEILQLWCGFSVPTVVSAQGRCMGAGACLWVGADFRFVAPDFKLQFPEVDRGLHLSWRILPRMGRELGWPLARRLAIAAIPAKVADLPPHVAVVSSDPDEDAWKFMSEQAAKPPLAVRAITEVFRVQDRFEQAHAEGDVAAFAKTAGSEDFLEAMGAWFAKRPASYRGR